MSRGYEDRQKLDSVLALALVEPELFGQRAFEVVRGVVLADREVAAVVAEAQTEDSIRDSLLEERRLHDVGRVRVFLSAHSTVRGQAEAQDSVCFLRVQHAGLSGGAAESRQVLRSPDIEARLLAEFLQFVSEQEVVHREVSGVRTAFHVALGSALPTMEKLHFFADEK